MDDDKNTADQLAASIATIDQAMTATHGIAAASTDVAALRAELTAELSVTSEGLFLIAELASRWKYRPAAPLIDFADPLDRQFLEDFGIDDAYIDASDFLALGGGSPGQLVLFALYADGSPLVAVPVDGSDVPRVVMLDHEGAFWHDGGSNVHTVDQLPTLAEWTRRLAEAHSDGRFIMTDFGHFEVVAGRDGVEPDRSYPWDFI